MVGKLILHCFHARTNAHVLHLTTRSYAVHKALNEFYDEIVDLADTIAECYAGDYGIIKFPDVPYKPSADALEMLDDLRECADKAYGGLADEDSHIKNAIDEIKALITSTQYKLRFLK